jgi:hypothetical protein
MREAGIKPLVDTDVALREANAPDAGAEGKNQTASQVSEK